MARALIQPSRGTPAPSGARGRGARRIDINSPSARSCIQRNAATTTQGASRGALRPGYGLLIAAGASLGLWAGLAKLVLMALR